PYRAAGSNALINVHLLSPVWLKSTADSILVEANEVSGWTTFGRKQEQAGEPIPPIPIHPYLCGAGALVAGKRHASRTGRGGVVPSAPPSLSLRRKSSSSCISCSGLRSSSRSGRGASSTVAS